MFSVKHVHADCSEEFWLAETLRYFPHDYNCANEGSPSTVYVTKPDGRGEPLQGGTVFVMNEAGRTVQRYDLDGSPLPAAFAA